MARSYSQPGILAPLAPHARSIQLRLLPGAEPLSALRRVEAAASGELDVVVGLGATLVRRVGGTIPGLRQPRQYERALIDIPSTPTDLWCWLRGPDPGQVLLDSKRLLEALGGGFEAEASTPLFVYGEGRDLTGYIDGTENPSGARAAEVALAQGQPGIAGSSFVAVQQWRHQLRRFAAFSPEQRDNIIGRRRADDEELEDAPRSAHVKRTAQEDFTPEAFVLRRSMPWAERSEEGLLFVAFGASLDPFEALLRRMVGDEDGVVDALFQFTHPMSSAYYWCPPATPEGLDLSALVPGGN